MFRAALFPTLLALALGGCTAEPGGSSGDGLSGTVRLDGSSTVFPISEAVAEEFGKLHPGVRVTVGLSGTGGGFKKFSAGEIDINDASRPIKGSEIEKCAEHQVEFIELPVAFDGISIVTHPENDFLDRLSVDELNKIWKPSSPANRWSEVRAGWPDRPIQLYGPGVDSGTFDYFTEVINGKSQVCRSDFTQSEDDNVLVRGVAGDSDSLGFFGYAYYSENRGKLKVVPVSADGDAVEPTDTTINNGTYAPLSRPLFIYVTVAAARRPEVKAFVEFYLENAPQLVAEVGYVPLPDSAYALALKRFRDLETGSVFSGRKTAGMPIEEVLSTGN